MRIAAAIALAAVLAGCPSKDKKDAAKPGDDKASTDPANADPEGGLPDTKAAGKSGGADSGDPALRPPGLDLSPAERQRRVAGHLRAGKAAMDKQPADAAEAIRQARLALAIDEASLDAMVILAHANISKRYYDQALDVLEKASERGGAKRREIQFLFGLVYDRTDEPDKAYAAYRRAVALSPDYKSALMNLGVHYLRNQRYADAALVYEKLTGKLGYSSAAAWTNLGSAYRGQSASFGIGQQQRRNQLILKAESTYRRALREDKTYANAHYNLGLLYLDSDPYPVAGGKEMDNLRRLKRAKSFFDEYRRLPGADLDRVDDVAATAQKLIGREERLRKKRSERERRRRERDRKK